jgi:hypothetical protein
MPDRNRVTPTGDIVAATPRGAWMGNRGVLHAATGREIVRRQRSRAWIVCRTEFRGRRVPQWTPGRYTPLFFLDEAVAFAAGHRPCGECRHHDFVAFREAAGFATAGELDRRLAAERGSHPLADWADLPDGTFVLLDDGPALVAGDTVRPWDDDAYGYGPARPRPATGRVPLVTPPTTVDVLRAGVPVQFRG